MADILNIDLKSLNKDKLTELLDVEKKLQEPGMLIELLDEFLNHCKSRAALMAGLYKQGNFDSMRNEAHSLKSAAGNLGGNKFAAICEAIENNVNECKNKADPDFLKKIQQLVSAFETEWPALEKEITKVRSLLKG